MTGDTLSTYEDRTTDDQWGRKAQANAQ